MLGRLEERRVRDSGYDQVTDPVQESGALEYSRQWKGVCVP